MDAENNRPQRLLVFWYIVLVDIAAGFFLSLSPSSFLLGLLINKLPLGPASVERSLELWLIIIIRAFEFSVMIRWLGRPPKDVLSDFGLQKGLWVRGLATGTIAALVLGGGFILCNAVLSRWAGWSPAEHLGLSGEQTRETIILYRFSYIAAACVAAPFFEDVFFVGLLFSALRSRFRLPAAFILALGCFVAAHILVNLLPAMSGGAFWEVIKEARPQIIKWTAGGALFIGLYARFKTLLPGMVVHGIGNAVIFYFS